MPPSRRWCSLVGSVGPKAKLTMHGTIYSKLWSHTLMKGDDCASERKARHVIKEPCRLPILLLKFRGSDTLRPDRCNGDRECRVVEQDTERGRNDDIRRRAPASNSDRMDTISRLLGSATTAASAMSDYPVPFASRLHRCPKRAAACFVPFRPPTL